MKALSKEYGYTALGVYLLISALDFPFCFVAVRLIGAEVVGEYEEVAVGWIRSIAPEGWFKKKEVVEEVPLPEGQKKKTSKSPSQRCPRWICAEDWVVWCQD